MTTAAAAATAHERMMRFLIPRKLTLDGVRAGKRGFNANMAVAWRGHVCGCRAPAGRVDLVQRQVSQLVQSPVCCWATAGVCGDGGRHKGKAIAILHLCAGHGAGSVNGVLAGGFKFIIWVHPFIWPRREGQGWA